MTLERIPEEPVEFFINYEDFKNFSRFLHNLKKGATVLSINQNNHHIPEVCPMPSAGPLGLPPTEFLGSPHAPGISPVVSPKGLPETGVEVSHDKSGISEDTSGVSPGVSPRGSPGTNSSNTFQEDTDKDLASENTHQQQSSVDTDKDLSSDEGDQEPVARKAFGATPNQEQVSGQEISEQMITSEKKVLSPGQQVSFPGSQALSPGQQVSPPGQTFTRSPQMSQVSSPGQQVSPQMSHVATSGHQTHSSQIFPQGTGVGYDATLISGRSAELKLLNNDVPILFYPFLLEKDIPVRFSFVLPNTIFLTKEKFSLLKIYVDYVSVTFTILYSSQHKKSITRIIQTCPYEPYPMKGPNPFDDKMLVAQSHMTQAELKEIIQFVKDQALTITIRNSITFGLTQKRSYIVKECESCTDENLTFLLNSAEFTIFDKLGILTDKGQKLFDELQIKLWTKDTNLYFSAHAHSNENIYMILNLHANQFNFL